MPKYVAFLRAINVGNHTVKMDHLRRLFEDLGLANVETFIASGNVIFDSKTTNTKSLERKIEKHLEKSLGYAVTTFVRSISELAEIAQYEPFAQEELSADGNTLFVCFVNDKPATEAKKKLASCASSIDGFHINEREVYWLYRRNNGESKFYGGPLEKTLGRQTTIRNVNTVLRLVKKYNTQKGG
jgi:uncharacterized protein (DUF1697 family)